MLRVGADGDVHQSLDRFASPSLARDAHRGRPVCVHAFIGVTACAL